MAVGGWLPEPFVFRMVFICLAAEDSTSREVAVRRLEQSYDGGSEPPGFPPVVPVVTLHNACYLPHMFPTTVGTVRVSVACDMCIQFSRSLICDRAK